MSIIPTGIPLVLLNAFPVDRAQWEDMLEVLSTLDAPIGDIITFDVPGIGDMPIPQDDPSLELIADAATLAMREVTGEHAALWVGSSMGGYIAMAVAERHADAVAGVVLIGTKASADTAEAREKRLKLAKDLDDSPHAPDPLAMAQPLIGIEGPGREGLIAWVAQNIARHSGAGIAWGQRAMAARPDRLKVLTQLETPAAVVRGEFDSISSHEDAVAMANALGVDVHTVPGVGHLTALEDSRTVATIVADLARAIVSTTH